MSDFSCSCSTSGLVIKQGDACSLGAVVKLNDAALTEDDLELIEEVEFTFADTGLRKLYPKEVSFVGGMFMIPLTQEETFNFDDGLLAVDARIQFVQNGNVIGTTAFPRLRVAETFSEVIL